MEQQRKEKRRKLTKEDDLKLTQYVDTHGGCHWKIVAQNLGIGKSSGSCRQRWLNYLLPKLKRGDLTEEERVKILKLYSKWGKKWAKIARELPGRTDNAVKNFCNKHLAKQNKQATVPAAPPSEYPPPFPPPAAGELQDWFDGPISSAVQEEGGGGHGGGTDTAGAVFGGGGEFDDYPWSLMNPSFGP